MSGLYESLLLNSEKPPINNFYATELKEFFDTFLCLYFDHFDRFAEFFIFLFHIAKRFGQLSHPQ